MGTLELIKKYLNSHVDHPPENLTLTSRLEEIGLDSLAMLELMFQIEDEYDVKLPNNAPKPETVGQLVELIEKFKLSVV